jgi:hypothetical protein
MLTKRILALLLSFSVNWCLAGVVLWWAYDFGPGLTGISHGHALVLVTKMGLVITVLTVSVWVLADQKWGASSGWRSFMRVAWATAIVLLSFALIVICRRILWRPEQGDKAFFPILDTIISEFFKEFLWLNYVLEVVPVMCCISGALYLIQLRLANKIPSPKSIQH